MLGSIIGDVIGSVFEFNPVKTTSFPLFCEVSTFTDDTVLTIAVAKCILDDCEYVPTLKDFTLRYPGQGYGHHYYQWAISDNAHPYNSFGNGSAMRVSPVGFAFQSRSQVLVEAEKSAKITHNHPEGIKGSQAVALAVYMARQGESKGEIKHEINKVFGYDLSRTIEMIRPTYHFDVTCQGSVPEAIIAFLESSNYEDAIRLSISLGGDADTQACITGGIAEAFYKDIPSDIVEETRARLPEEFLTIIDRFRKKYLGL